MIFNYQWLFTTIVVKKVDGHCLRSIVNHHLCVFTCSLPSWALQLSIVLSKLLVGFLGEVRRTDVPCCCCCCCTVSLNSFRSISALMRSEGSHPTQIFSKHGEIKDQSAVVIPLGFRLIRDSPKLRLRMPPVPELLSCLTGVGRRGLGLLLVFRDAGDAVGKTLKL